MENWLVEVFGTAKPIIAMVHLLALPGDPNFDEKGGMDKVILHALQDIEALQAGGVDALMFSNEYSLPYLTRVEPITTAAMARVVGELRKEIRIPFGANVLWDPAASLDLAMVTGAKFVREIFTGVYASDFGLWNPNAGELIRHQHRIGAGHVKLLYNIVPEAAVYLGERDMAEIAQSTVFNCRPDGLCVSGLTAGEEADLGTLRIVKDAVPETIVFANTGVNLRNVAEQLAIADGAVVGTAFKKGGETFNPVDEGRVRALMEIVREIRGDELTPSW
ncbi:MAG: BtpA/SgcQ family protein [Anaerolineales bacterium]|nr:BtpA/SgcQ family protein [Anaerolineales bacterium]